MGLFNRKSKQAKSRPIEVSNGKPSGAPVRVRWQSTWTSSEVAPDEIEELVHAVTAEMKLRAEALNTPFLLLPFRPSTEPSPARSFINTFFKSNASGSQQYRGVNLQQELRLTGPTVLCSVLKWCWSRMPKGVVSWPVYEAFRLGEKESNMARNAFDTFVPLASDSPARTRIIYDFFDLLAAVAAHGKLNGLGGRKLSRLAGWWAFEHSDGGKGFEGGYKSWTTAADASSHLFFAYLRSLSPDVEPSMNVIERIPRSLQALLAQTEYPPETPVLLQRTTPRVVMIVDQVSPTPFSLLRRAKHFEYRQNDRVLREYSDFEDPVTALTDECKRVLFAIASTNSSGAPQSSHGLAKPDETWTSFTSVGFGDLGSANGANGARNASGVSRPGPSDLDRPTTPSWGDFLSSGFHNEVSKSPSTMLLPPDKVLPPIQSRTQTPSIMSGTDHEEDLSPGELAAITSVELDDAFWWVWMTSLAGEEPNERKAVFGRCALIETSIFNGQWLIMEEQVKGATPDPLEGAQIVEKKSRFSFSRRSNRNKLARGKPNNNNNNKKKKAAISAVTEAAVPEIDPKANRQTLSLEQESRIREAAAELARKNDNSSTLANARRGRLDDYAASKTQSTLTMGLQTAAGPAMKWASTYDKDAIRSAYLGSNLAGTGQYVSSDDLLNNIGTIDEYPAAQSEQFLPSERDPAPVAQVPFDGTAHDDAFVSAKQSVETDVHSRAPPAMQYNPLEKEIMAEKTVDHPAYRETESVNKVDSGPNPAILAARMALEGRAVSPESAKSSKLKKQPNDAGASGFKKFFSRKPDRRSVDAKRYQANTGVTNTTTESASTTRLPVIADQPLPSQRPAAVQQVQNPVPPMPHEPYNVSTAALSRVDSRDQREADIAFSQFDQAAPVAEPDVEPLKTADSMHEAAEAPVVPRKEPAQERTVFELPSQYVPPAPVVPEQPAAPEPVPTEEVQSKPIVKEVPKEAPPSNPPPTFDSSKDRWERIRENAARRAANARASEDTSTKSRPTESGRTEDGDTSGEETIESRVARIKARVAELTSNMDSSTSAGLRR